MRIPLFIALMAALPMTASATLITFNLAGNSGDGAEGALLDNLVAGTVTKNGLSATLSTNSARLFNQTTTNFGINLDRDGCDVSAQIDGECGNESIQIMLSQLAELVSITLSSYSPSDNALLTFNNPATQSMFGSIDLPSTPSTLPIGAPVGGLGNDFTLAFGAGNGFSFDSFTINTAQDVPEPTSIALIGAGVIAFGVRRRKKRSLVV